MRKHDMRTLSGTFLLSMVIAACGGGAELGGSAGNGDGGGSGPDDEATVDSIVLLTSSTQLPSSATDPEDGIALTAIARDSGGAVVEGVQISFGANPGGTLQVLDPVTTEAGRASAILTTPGDARNRTITVTASGEGAQTSQAVEVVGTRLEITGPQAIRPQASENFELRLIDAAGNGISGQRIDISSANGNTIQPTTVDTNATGRAQVTVTATMPGEDTLTFEGFDLSEEASFLTSRFQIEFLTPEENLEASFQDTVDIEVAISEQGSPAAGETVDFSATRGDLSSLSGQTDAQGRARVTLSAQSSDGAGPVLITAKGPEGEESVERSRQIELVSTSPESITAQSEPATLSRSEESVITARVTDADGNPVKNQTVRFSLQDTSAGGLTTGIATTDTQGIARTSYQPGDTGSGTESVVITASIGNPEIASDEVTLTVRAAPLFIVLGSDNQITKRSGDGEPATYSKVYNAIITDAAGNPPPEDTEFRLTLRSLEYQKGSYVRGAERWIQVPTVAGDDPFFGTPNPDPAVDFGPYFGQGPFGCRAEDPLGTGDLNRSADYNGNGNIDPPNVATVPATADINENGVASFDIEWAQSVAQWVLVRLSVTARVDGTESTRRLDFTLPVAAEDVNDLDVTPPNLTSPFGTADECVNPS
jgi:hypothetical protein